MLNNHLMVTKDNDKKIKIKQDFIKESESFLILDENGDVYNKEKTNLINLGYDVKIINFVDKNNTNHYNPLNYFTENSLLEGIYRWLTNKTLSYMFTYNDYCFLSFLEEFIKNSKNKTVENFIKEINNYINQKENNYSFLDFAKNNIHKLLPDLFNDTTSFIMNDDNVDLNNIINKKTAIFIIYDKNKKNYKTLTSLLIYQLYEILLKNLKNKKFNFILDDLKYLNLYHSNMIFQYQIDEINFNVFINSFDEFSKDINQLTFLILNFMDLNEKINSYLHFGGEIHLEKEYSLSILFCKFSLVKYRHKKYEGFFKI